MKLLPIALNVEGKRCLIVGGGPVAHRKAQPLLECGAKVTLIAPALCDAFEPIIGNMDYLPRVFQDGDCSGYHLVFACTNNAGVNKQVVNEAQAHDIWCNVTDASSLSDFHSAALVQRGDIVIGITTTGGSPALARHLKAQIQESIGPEYEQLLDIMSARRAFVKEQWEHQPDRARLWRAILSSSVLSLLRRGQRTEAEAIVNELISLNEH